MKKRKTDTKDNDHQMSASEFSQEITDNTQVGQSSSGTATATSEEAAAVFSHTGERRASGSYQSRSVRMSQEDRLRYMVPVYAQRLRDTAEMMKGYLERGEGTAHEIERRIKALETLYTMVENELHEAAVEYAIKNGIKSSLLQGGGGFPSLTGAHFDYIVTVMPNRSAEMRELIYQRRMTAWKTTDRAPKVSERGPEIAAAEEFPEDANTMDAA